MDTRLRLLSALVLLLLSLRQTAVASEANADSARSSLLDNGVARTLKHIYTQCADNGDIFRCVKVQGAKLLGRALKVPNISLVEGVSIVRRSDEDTRAGRSSVADTQQFSNRDLEQLSTKSLDALLFERLVGFVRSRQLLVNVPRLLAFGQRNGQSLIDGIVGLFTQAQTAAVEEGRKKKDDKKYLGPFIAAVMLKAAILKMAYHSIAIVAGKALIVGKIALIISAIIGLKKLVGGEGGEKTTYEIVKHPQVQQSHTYSSSHANEYEGHEGSYHRSMEDEMMMQDKAYNAWVPSKIS